MSKSLIDQKYVNKINQENHVSADIIKTKEPQKSWGLWCSFTFLAEQYTLKELRKIQLRLIIPFICHLHHLKIEAADNKQQNMGLC